MVRQKRNIDFGFWVNFRQEDRICRKGGEEKAETGDWRPERKGRATGEGRGDFGCYLEKELPRWNSRSVVRWPVWEMAF